MGWVLEKVRGLLRLIAAVAVCAVVLAACSSDASDSTDDEGNADGEDVASIDFSDQSIPVIVNFSSGGGCDTGARLLLQHLPQNVPGQPDMFVENVDGAGGIVGLNQLFTASAETGETMGWLCGMMAPQALGVDTVQYSAAEFKWLAAALESQVLYATTELGVTSLAELADAEGVISGGFAPDSTKDLGLQTLLSLLGGDYQHVSGYPGNSDLRAAIERGEINVHEETVTGHLTAMQQLLDAGTIVVLGQRGIPNADGEIVRDPRIPDIPTYTEILLESQGEAISERVEFQALESLVKVDSFLRALVYPPSTDDEYVAAMRLAVVETITSEDFLSAAAESLGAEPILVSGEDAQAAVEDVFSRLESEPEARDYLKDLATSE